MAKNENCEETELRLYRYNDEYVRYYNNYCYCGEPGEIGQEPEQWIPASDILETDGQSSYVADILGDSMIEADIRPGDKVVIDGTKQPREHDKVRNQVATPFRVRKENKYKTKTQTKT